MSHQTGIKSSQELKDFFRRCTTADEIRLLKIGIENEKLECLSTVEMRSGSWRDEYDEAVKPLLRNDQPCYMLYRLDGRDQWLFIAFTPDDAQVREKMLYSGTRATVKAEFGGGFIINELVGTSINDVLLSGYDEHVRSSHLPPPLTDAEEELKLVKEAENKTEVHIDTKHKTNSGLSFPLTDELVRAIAKFKDGVLNYLQLRINIEEELIFLADQGQYPASDLAKFAPHDDAYYHIYRYDHTFGGQSQSVVVFIYTMPEYKSSIKSRMLYSSCKGTLIDDLEQYGLKIDKRLELQDEAITEDLLMSEVHPPAAEVKEKFLKPKAPGRKGSPRRMIRSNNP